MQIMTIHHLGYLVKNINRAVKAFENLGYVSTSETVYDEYRGVDIVFMSKDGYVIELVSPKGKESTVSGLFKRFGNSPYHICYETDDLDGQIQILTESGYVMWEEPHPAVAISNKKVCFLVHPYIGMIELVEKGE